MYEATDMAIEARAPSSRDPKQRLRWTPELHDRFVDAVTQLGGPDKATPKTVMRIMGIKGLTLYHLKSHLQKFRLGKQSNKDQNQDNSKDGNSMEQAASTGASQNQTGQNSSENLQITEALRLQMEVQRKLHEQLEVQRHLQLRIEAQGKYLQSILEKARETLSGNNANTEGEIDYRKYTNEHHNAPFSSMALTAMPGQGNKQLAAQQQVQGIQHISNSHLNSMAILDDDDDDDEDDDYGQQTTKKKSKLFFGQDWDSEGNGDRNAQERGMACLDHDGNAMTDSGLIEKSMSRNHSSNGHPLIKGLQARDITSMQPLSFRMPSEANHSPTSSDQLGKPPPKRVLTPENHMSPFVMAGNLQHQGSCLISEMKRLYSTPGQGHTVVFGNNSAAAGLDLNANSDGSIAAKELDLNAYGWGR
ncbi:hypothetical protein O6H91_11G008100 [Diphasiastrum complanatum]|uniref:Uncharacterized protein n=3 Tax=Diphasiastrum complanatum TaxID=34168 RepID=A0ACC2C651_DIPCM|nr:hypothetical protein O6H91_11G007700 [Diphasiastrum complanatum]KAJ7537492.1 hypothetical protein O6H91_11G007700 [Diphasiastrum complanatum]KAJ7537496.1 hypothetical protein O6H91_11G008100 [Diphasiastrum complanatum]